MTAATVQSLQILMLYLIANFLIVLSRV